MNPAVHADDAWFDLVPLAMLDSMSTASAAQQCAVNRLFGHAIPPGTIIRATPAMQRLWLGCAVNPAGAGPRRCPSKARQPSPPDGARPLANPSKARFGIRLRLTQPALDVICAPFKRHPARTHGLRPVWHDHSMAPTGSEPGAVAARTQHDPDSTPAGIAYMRGDGLALQSPLRTHAGLTPAPPQWGNASTPWSPKTHASTWS